MTDDEIERRIMALLLDRQMCWMEISEQFPLLCRGDVDAAMLRLDRYGAIVLDRRTGRYERYDKAK